MRFLRRQSDGTLVIPYTKRMLLDDFGKVASFDQKVFIEPELDMLQQFGVFPIIENPPSFDENTEVLVLTHVELEGGQYLQRYRTDPLPSELDGGDRPPTSAELDAQPDMAEAYWRSKIEERLNEVAGSRPLPFGHEVTERGRIFLKPDINNVNSYCFDHPSNFLQEEAENLRLWRVQMWATALTIVRTWRARGRTQSPTWAELLAMLPAPPAPPESLTQ